jgi:hypothetical protein
MEFARDYLEDILTTEDKPSSYIFEAMKQKGICERTVRSAVKELEIRSYRKGKIWYMHMDKQQKM